ncbi:MAG: class I SAM-dependent methyltransferase [archaeon]|jgi:ubiquinone/menaquinone biosynthesis C-methylase UbiE|nr:class I SAM-dependent methyltransferase [archaeon]
MESQESVWDKLYHKNLRWKKESISLPNILKGKAVLELGVGNGKTLISILKQSPKSVTAVDFSQEAISRVKDSIPSQGITFLKADVTQISFNEEFDVIICYYVLDNLLEKERKEAISKMRSALKPNGAILFEDFAVGDFREKEGIKNIESHTFERNDGLICHFFMKKELESLFKSFSSIRISEKNLRPIRLNRKLERRIVSAIIRK